jgi:hypothetical protein
VYSVSRVPWLASTDGLAWRSLLFTLAFLWLSAAMGRRLMRLLGVPADDALAERAVVGTALGVGLLQFVPFALGAVGALTPTALRITIGVIALLAALDLIAVASAGLRAVKGWTRPQTWLLVWFAVIAPAVIVIFFLAVTPSIDPDGLAYHLTVPKRWLQLGSLAYLPTYQPSNSPMGVEMLFTIALVFEGDISAKLLHFALGMVGAFGLYLAGKRLQGPTVGALAAALFLVGPGGAGHLLGWAFVEGAAGFALVASALAWLVWFEKRQIGWLRCAALLAGVGASFKITAALLPAALVALTILVLWNDGRTRQPPQRPALARLWPLLVLVAVPVAPWLIRSAIVTGNPFFPMFARLIPSRDMPAALSTAYDNFNRYNTWGTGLSSHFTLGQRKLMLVVAGLGLIFAGGVIFWRLKSWLGRGTVVVVVCTALAQLMAAGLYTRYWVPILAALQLPIAALIDRTFAQRWRPFVAVGLTAVCSLMMARKAVGSVGRDLGGLVRTAAGLRSHHSFMEQQLALLPLYEHVNRELPADARVILSCTCNGFYVDRSTLCAEFPQDSLRFTVWNELVEDVRRLRVTHVMAPRTLAEGGPSPAFETSSTSMLRRAQEYELLRRLLGQHARLLASAADQGLYELEINSLR